MFGEPFGVGRVGVLRGSLAVGVLVMRLRQQADQAGAGTVGGQVQRKHLVAEGGLGGEQSVVVVGPRVVEFGDHHSARHADLLAFLPQRLGEFVDALVRRDHEQRAVGGPQPGAQFADEVCVSGGVDQVQLDAVVREGRKREPDGSLLGYLGVIGVAYRRAVDDGSGARQHPCGGQQGFDEGGFAATRWAYEHHVSDGGRTFRGGGGSGARRIVRLVCHEVPPPPGRFVGPVI